MSDTVETLLTFVQRLWEAGYYAIGALIGLFMILWGVFFNGWDWILIAVGIVTFLICGWYTYRVLVAN